jgi:hypothetical protein
VLLLPQLLSIRIVQSLRMFAGNFRLFQNQCSDAIAGCKECSDLSNAGDEVECTVTWASLDLLVSCPQASGTPILLIYST